MVEKIVNILSIYNPRLITHLGSVNEQTTKKPDEATTTAGPIEEEDPNYCSDKVGVLNV